jgi:hypothetical protein
MSIFRTADIFGDYGDIRINTYSTGFRQAVGSLLDAE